MAMAQRAKMTGGGRKEEGCEGACFGREAWGCSMVVRACKQALRLGCRCEGW